MILVTGATGTVGSEVVKRLSAHGIKARAVTRDLGKPRPIHCRTSSSSRAILTMLSRCVGRAPAWHGLSC
jgi:nucleoside-diphosphate-sugar epimerase